MTSRSAGSDWIYYARLLAGGTDLLEGRSATTTTVTKSMESRSSKRERRTMSTPHRWRHVRLYAVAVIDTSRMFEYWGIVFSGATGLALSIVIRTTRTRYRRLLTMDGTITRSDHHRFSITFGVFATLIRRLETRGRVGLWTSSSVRRLSRTTRGTFTRTTVTVTFRSA